MPAVAKYRPFGLNASSETSPKWPPFRRAASVHESGAGGAASSPAASAGGSGWPAWRENKTQSLLRPGHARRAPSGDQATRLYACHSDFLTLGATRPKSWTRCPSDTAQTQREPSSWQVARSSP